MSTLKVQLEDTDGNVYYMKTDANSVYCEDGFSVQHYLNNVILKDKIINNTNTADSTKVASAYVANNLQNQITTLNAKINSIYLEKISTTMGSNQSAIINAPSIDNRIFICWIGTASIGWLGTFYFLDPSVPNTSVWCTVNNPGATIECFALYRDN